MKSATPRTEERREAGAGNEVCIANDPADLGPVDTGLVDTGEGGDNGANCEEQRRCRNFKPSHSLQLVHTRDTEMFCHAILIFYFKTFR